MKIPRQEYTLEIKELAVKRIKDGQAIAPVAKESGINAQTLSNWIGTATRALTGKAEKTVTEEQIDLSRLVAENIRLKRGSKISKTAVAYFAKDVA